MSALLFSKGALLGLAIAAPLGPIGALCINRTLQRGFVAGVAGGLGTATADACYVAAAAFGFVAFTAIMAVVSKPLAIGGGLFLLGLGLKYLIARETSKKQLPSSGDFCRTFSTTFALTIGNPATVLTVAALFASLGLAGTLDRPSAIILVLGVFAGSMAWWFMLSAGVTFARSRLPKSFATWVNRVSGIVILLFGLASIWSVMSG
jgi:putative LysE/RhtB family amino acid efflux pump